MIFSRCSGDTDDYPCCVGSQSENFAADYIAEKAKGLNLVMLQNSGKGDWEFTDKMLAAVAIFKIEVTTLSCKEHE